MRLLAAVLLLVLTACGVPEVKREVHVDVDTPALRNLKASAGIKDCPETTGERVDSKLPDVTLPCLGGGREVDLRRVKGPLVVNLWAQWCGPCRTELPHYQAFSEKYDGRVSVLGIDWNDTQPSRALAMAQEAGVTYPLLADTEPAIRGQVLPRVLLIDAKGKVVHDQAVEIKSVKQLEDLVAEHLEVS